MKSSTSSGSVSDAVAARDRSSRKRWTYAGLLAALGVILAWFLTGADPLPVRATLPKSSLFRRVDLITADGKTLVTSEFYVKPGSAHTPAGMTLWDTDPVRLRARIVGPDRLVFLTASPDGRYLAAVGMVERDLSWKVFVHDTARATELARLDVPGGYHLAFRSDGTALDVTTIEQQPPPDGDKVKAGAVTSWDTSTWIAGRPKAWVARPQGSLGFARDGRTVLAVRQYQSGRGVSVWDVDRAEPVAVLMNPASKSAKWSAQFVEAGKTVAVGGSDGRVELWDMASRTLRADIAVHSDGYVAHRILLAPGSPYLVSSARWMKPLPGWLQAKAAFNRWLGPSVRAIDPLETVVWDLIMAVGFSSRRRRSRAASRTTGRPW